MTNFPQTYLLIQFVFPCNGQTSHDDITSIILIKDVKEMTNFLIRYNATSCDMSNLFCGRFNFLLQAHT